MLVHRPAIYEHAAALIGCDPRDVQADAALLARAHLAAAECYHLAHVVVGMDLYGCDAAAWSLAAGRDTPIDLADLASLPPAPFPAGGQVNVLRAAAELRRRLPDSVGVRVPVTGPFSLAAQIVGFEPLLVGLLDDAPLVEAGLDRLTDAVEQYVRAAGPTGCGVTFFESAASPPLVRPADFQRLVLPRLARLLAAARRAGDRSPPARVSADADIAHRQDDRENASGPAPRRNPELILGGPTGPILHLLLKLNPALVIADPANDPAEFLTRCRAAGVALRVNLESRLLLAEHRVEAHHRLEALARLARSAGDEPLFVATGVVPFDADPKTVLAFGELVEQVNQACL